MVMKLEKVMKFGRRTKKMYTEKYKRMGSGGRLFPSI